MLISPNQERALSYSAYQSILKKEKINRDPGLNQLINRVGKNIATSTNRSDFSWEFILIDNDKTANAFALPGGKVFIYTGILKYTRNEAGLATVISHEVAHVIARHGAERMSMTLLAQLGEAAVRAAVSSQSPEAASAFNSAYGITTQMGVLLPYSRTQEFEADHIGLILMAKAGYDPRRALEFWERLSKEKNRHNPPAFLSTHPTGQDRIQKIQELMPEALSYYRGHPYH
jgi:predicted Zn-dependent protease